MKLDLKEIKRFLLIYYVDDYPANGGGLNYVTFDTIEEVENWINEEDKEDWIIESLVEVAKIMKISPVTKVTKFEIE